MSDPQTRDHGPEIEATESDVELDDIRWFDMPVLAIFWVLAFIVFLQFFTRYVLNNSLGWTEEIARYLLIAVTFTGAIMATRKADHIAVEFIYRWVPRPLRRGAQLAIDAVAVAFFAGMTWLTYQLAGRTQQMMVSLDVPKSLVYYYVCVCFAFMALFAAWNAWRHLTTGTSALVDPDSDAGDVRTMD